MARPAQCRGLASATRLLHLISAYAAAVAGRNAGFARIAGREERMDRGYAVGMGPGDLIGNPSGMSSLNCARERSSAFVRVTAAMRASASV